MKTNRLDSDKCLGCGKLINAATDVVASREPEPGDITICLDCGHIMAFDVNLKVRPLSDEEIIRVAGNPIILRMQDARIKQIGLSKVRM